jgi:signal peptidase I
LRVELKFIHAEKPVAESKQTAVNPFWVRTSLWGLQSRASALLFFWASIGGGIACCVGGFWNRRLILVGSASLGVAVIYRFAVRWVDRHGNWSSRRRGRFHLVWAFGVLVVFGGTAAFAVFRLMIVDHYQASQDAMYPTVPTGSRFIALRYPYRDVSEVQRGDIVVFFRRDRGEADAYIWRVVGLPGDIIQMTADGVVVNGQPLKHEKIRTERDFTIFRETNGAAAYDVAYKTRPPRRTLPKPAGKVAPNHVFVLGDNRSFANDSSKFGSIPFDAIVAKKW